MSALLHFDAEAIRSVVDMPTCIEALRVGSLQLGPLHPRAHVSLGPSDDFLMMPAVSTAGIGVKVVNVVSSNRDRGLPLIHGFYLYCDRETGVPLATLDGSALTTLRTPAASALAADLLARPEATSLGIFGTGVQARGHLEAMLVVRPSVVKIVVCGRTKESSHAFLEDPEVKALVGDRHLLGGTPKTTGACDVVCGCTTSSEPVIPTLAVQPGAHVGLVGSYSTARREVAPDLLTRSSVFVDNRETAAAEAGDLILAAESGTWSFDDVAGDLTELCLGEAGRSSDNEITLFKSVGLAAWDLIVAGTVVKAK
ncbi:MAG: hypothetical protein L7T80_04400 [Arenicellales bacterium]|nr:hypothetical protein [Arenicellales bacterium]